jgi:hypothetical protein
MKTKSADRALEEISHGDMRGGSCGPGDVFRRFRLEGGCGGRKKAPDTKTSSEDGIGAPKGGPLVCVVADPEAKIRNRGREVNRPQGERRAHATA